MLRSPKRFAGLVALSTHLPLPGTIEAEVENASGAGNTDVPAFVAHGTADPMVPIEGGRHAAQVLESLGYDVEWHEYPMAHAVHPREIADIARFIVDCYSD